MMINKTTISFILILLQRKHHDVSPMDLAMVGYMITNTTDSTFSYAQLLKTYTP